ncbi:MAG: LD-carboxypeptidase [Candidatus Delongbacteria bacterium]|nr:LD-carboxypeptidase [Candidatus Delongbacteria bacterium]
MIRYPACENSLIAITAPAGSPPPGTVEQAVTFLESQDLRVVTDNSHQRQYGYLAGTDNQRRNALLQLWRDPEVEIILAARGGFGTTRLLATLPWQELGENPKLLLGYSDLTALQNALLSCSGVASVSAPMAATELTTMPDTVTWNSLHPFLRYGFSTHSDQRWSLTPEQVLVAGRGEGVLVGGNLSVFTSLFGTPFLKMPEQFVLLLEEQGEYPFRLDRYLRMLANAGWLERAAGILLGHFVNCIEPDQEKSTFTAEELIQEYFGSLHCPVIQHLPYGHAAPRLSLPIGGLVRLDTATGLLDFTRQL